jgi:4-hydroxybenzoate polyprenyltransferase
MLGVVLMAIHLLRQARMINPDDPQGALTLFKSNRNAGLILTLFLIVDRLLG